MVGTVEQIERELTALEQSSQAIAQELHDVYADYLKVLGKTVSQQMILASYHLCTKGYPAHFLKLSFNQRQQLQQSLRQLGNQVQEKLLAQLQSLDFTHPDAEPSPAQVLEITDTAVYEALISKLEASQLLDASDSEMEESLMPDGQVIPTSEATDAARYDHPLVNIEELLPIEALNSAASEPLVPELGADQFLESTLEGNDQSVLEADDQSMLEADGQSTIKAQTLTPLRLAIAQAKLERGLTQTLQKLSQDANHLLQQYGILPKHLPEPVLMAAAKSDAATEIVSGPPNLLNLLVENPPRDNPKNAESADKPKRPSVTHIMAIHLRLSEIEFTDAGVSAWRTKIRGILGRLKTLGRNYEKKHKEKAIAEADAAWRASWFDD
ncbi:MAG: hypothetical protein F6K19_16280 [Cyanothece sp. SIO1E1]|nr:hypothetical protein [Cyanothece sp. SIO1E1]